MTRGRPVHDLDRSGIDERPHDLLDEEGVAAGAGQNPILRALRKAAQQLIDERLRLSAVQRLELQLGVERAVPAAHRLEQPVARPGVVGPERSDEEHSMALGRPEQPLEQLNRRPVRPVQVLEDHDDRPGGRGALEEIAQAPEDEAAERVSPDPTHAQRVRAGKLEPHHRRDERVVVEQRGAVDVADRGLELRGRVRLAVVVANARPPPEHLDDRVVAEIRAGGQRASDEHGEFAGGPLPGDAFGAPREKLRHEPRLADARLSRDRHDRPAARQQLEEVLLEHRQVRFAADHLRAERIGRDRRRVDDFLRDDVVRGERFLASFDLERRQGGEAEFLPGLPHRLRADVDAAVRRVILQLRRDDYRVTQDGILPVCPGADRAGDHGARIDAEVHGEPLFRRTRPVGGAHRVADGDRRVQRLPRRVLDAARQAEEHGERSSHHAIDRAAVAGRDGRHVGHQLGGRLSPIVGAVAIRFGALSDLAEHDRGVAPLALPLARVRPGARGPSPLRPRRLIQLRLQRLEIHQQLRGRAVAFSRRLPQAPEDDLLQPAGHRRAGFGRGERLVVRDGVEH